MNAGMNLVALAQELQRQAESAKDYIAPQGGLRMELDLTPTAQPRVAPVQLVGTNGSSFAAGINEHAHGQLSDTLGIPKKYYDRMRDEQPGLLADNVNAWLHKDPSKTRMVRTLDGRVRALLSSSYRPLDNADLANAVLPVLISQGAQVVSTAVTETRLYVKAILPGLSDTIPEGLRLGQGHNFLSKDTVVAGIVVSNSEVGAGAIRVEPMVFKTRCTNLMIISESKMRKHHVGRDQGVDFMGGDIEELLRSETKTARDRAFWNTVRDIVSSAFNPEIFKRHVERMRQAAEDVIRTDDLPKVVEIVSKRLAVPEGLNNSILKALAAGADLTRWGLLNAYTNVANDREDYETSTMLERAGGEILALPARDWQLIAEAA